MAALERWVCRWNPAIPGKEWRRRNRTPVTVGQLAPGGTVPGPTTPTAQALFAGHIPNRVFLGMATPMSGYVPQFTEALSIIGQSVYESRRFVNSWITTASAESMVSNGDNNGLYSVISFKVPGDQWGNVTNGSLNADLVVLRNFAIGRRTSGPGGTPQPFACAVHHEPDGNGPIGDPAGVDRIANLTLWGQMQKYFADFFSGWRTGTYNAAEDVSDIMAWTLIPNGHWFGKRFPQVARRDAALPQATLNSVERAKGILLPDFYDVNPPGGAVAGGGYTGIEDRSSVQISGFIEWTRARTSRLAMGCGEWGCTGVDDEMLDVWKVMRDNRDRWAIGNYFNSTQNSRWDWRLIPANYPGGQNPTGSKGLVDNGGSFYTAANLAYYRQILTESVSTAYTGPLGGV